MLMAVVLLVGLLAIAFFVIRAMVRQVNRVEGSSVASNIARAVLIIGAILLLLFFLALGYCVIGLSGLTK
jgi:hypothetical protein